MPRYNTKCLTLRATCYKALIHFTDPIFFTTATVLERVILIPDHSPMSCTTSFRDGSPSKKSCKFDRMQQNQSGWKLLAEVMHTRGGGGLATGHTPTPSHFPATFKAGGGGGSGAG